MQDYYREIKFTYEQVEDKPLEPWESRKPTGFKGVEGGLVDGVGMNFSARFDLFIIRRAWDKDVDFEDLADGFGLGMGTMGDWSSIRDSSPEQIEKMFQRALNHFFA